MTTDEMIRILEAQDEHSSGPTVETCRLIAAKLKAGQHLAEAANEVWQNNEGSFDELECALNAYEREAGDK